MKRKNRIVSYLATAGVLSLALMTGITVAANIQSNNLDLLLGRGSQHVKDNSSLTADYIDFKFDNQEDALKNAQRMTQLTAEEGMTLLKNDDSALPIAKTDGVTVLGYYSWHNNMSGGEDPATTTGAISLGKGIKNHFGSKFNQATEDLYNTVSGDFDNPEASLASIESTFANYNTAIITIKRNSGEGNDQSLNVGAKEQNRSGLVITNAELKLIDYASKHFSKVIIVVNSANAMELGWLQENDPNMKDGFYTDPYTKTKYDFTKVKAAIWAGCCGSQGGTALANILTGEVTPSGHLVDTYVRDLRKDPTYQNFGSYLYDNSDELNSYQEETYFVDYEEGIYVGYRYYETAAKEGYINYDTSVVYPFGYGLSYTTFTKEIVSSSTFGDDVNVEVKVTNTGNKEGKEVVQLYYSAPYTKGGIEKSSTVLGDFAKTKTLKSGESETLKLTIKKEEMASYDMSGTGCYVLEQGNYIISVNPY